MGSLGSQEGNQEGTDGGMSPPETVATKKAREELRGLALESRTAYLSIALLPDSVLATRRNIESSAAYKRASGGNQRHRVVFLYAVGASWDQQRMTTKYGKRSASAIPLWKEDFQQFVETINPLITAEKRKLR